MNSNSVSIAPTKRILFITYNFPPKVGGMEQVALRCWEELSTRAEVSTLAQFAEPTADGPPALRPTKPGLLNFFRFLLREGRRIARAQGIDVVVSTSALTALPALHICKRAKAKSAVLIHGLDTIYPSLVYQSMYRFAMPNMDRIIANSHATRDEASQRGVAAERIVVAHPGCDVALFQSPYDPARLAERLGLQNEKVVMIPGRLVRRKGVDRFIRECLPLLLTQMPDVKLVLAGGNPLGALAHRDDMEAEVHRAIEETGHQTRVVLTGQLSQRDMVDAFHLAHVIVLPLVPIPGDMEGFGIVLIEAGAARKPVVASRIGGVIDAVADGTTGVLVPPADYPAMASAIVDLLRNPEKRARMGTAGYERTFSEFTWQKSAQRYADAILEL